MFLLVPYLITCLNLAMGDLTIRQNIVFEKVNQVTLSRSLWSLSFFVDFSPFEKFLNSLKTDIHHVTVTLYHVTTTFHVKNDYGFLEALKGLYEDYKSLSTRYDQLVDTFEKLLLLTPDLPKRETEQNGQTDTPKHRQKKSLLPFVGELYSGLFGLATTDQVDAIRDTVKQMREKQVALTHVLEHTISVLDVTRQEVSENRYAINKLILAAMEIDKELTNLTRLVNYDMQLTADLIDFISLYTKAERAYKQLSQAISAGQAYLEFIQSQLNQLSTRHIGPNLLDPKLLKETLQDIRRQLPYNLALPWDENFDLWRYYEVMTGTAVHDNKQLLVVTAIPLLNLKTIFDVTKIHNIPVPSIGLKYATAYFNLESDAMVINPERTLFGLMTKSELMRCQEKRTTICEIDSPIYSLSLSKMCVAAVFRNDLQQVKESCQTVVIPYTALPQAMYITEGIWVVTCRFPLEFAVVCQNNSRSTIHVTPFQQQVKLSMACTATSSDITLTAYYYKESHIDNKRGEDDLLKANLTKDTILWEPIERENLTLDHSDKDIPDPLKAIKKIDMNQYYQILKDIRKPIIVSKPKSWRYYLKWAAIYVAIIMICMAGLFILYKLGILGGLWSGLKKCCTVGKQAKTHGKRQPAPPVVYRAAPQEVTSIPCNSAQTSTRQPTGESSRQQVNPTAPANTSSSGQVASTTSLYPDAQSGGSGAAFPSFSIAADVHS